MNKKPFTHHTKSAIKVNKNRKKYYSDLTNGKSKSITFLLNTLSYLMLPIIFFIDISAKRFTQKGIKILENDFIELSEINQKDKSVEKLDIINFENYNYVNNKRINYIKSVKALLKTQNLLEICHKSSDFIESIEKIEKKGNCNIPMTKHIVESIGFNVLHGIEYSKQSNGKTLHLSNLIIRLHILGLNNSLNWIDKKCQVFFQNNVGIVINDIPSIPFVTEWKNFKNEYKEL